MEKKDNTEAEKAVNEWFAGLHELWYGKGKVNADTVRDCKALQNHMKLLWRVEGIADLPQKEAEKALKENIKECAAGVAPTISDEEERGRLIFFLVASNVEVIGLLYKYGLTAKFRKWVADCAKESCISPYGVTTQGLLPNQLRQIGKRTGSDLAKGDTLIFNGENVKLAFFESDKHGGVAMTVPMQKVLSMYHEELCKKLPLDWEELGKITLEELEQYSSVTITLDKYMELTGAKDKKTARAAIKDACDRLYFLSYVVVVKGKTYKGRLFSAMVETSYGGKFEMRYTPEYLRYCATTRPAAFHRGMYKINGKLNPYSWGLGEKLWQHYMINRGRANAERLSVGKLIEAVPDLPTYEEVIATDRMINRRIIEPMERDLDELKRLGVLKSWEYSNAKGAALTDEQVKNMDFNTWAKLYVSFVLDLPPQDKYIEAHKKRLAAAAKKKANREKKA